MILFTFSLCICIPSICFSNLNTTSNVPELNIVQPHARRCFDMNVFKCCYSYERLSSDDESNINPGVNRRKIMPRIVIGLVACIILSVSIVIFLNIFNKKQQSLSSSTSLITSTSGTAVSPTQETPCKSFCYHIILIKRSARVSSLYLRNYRWKIIINL